MLIIQPPQQARKRSAPGSDDEGVQKPAKRATVDTLSPTECEAQLPMPTSNKNLDVTVEVSRSELNKSKSSDSTCSVNSDKS